MNEKDFGPISYLKETIAWARPMKLIEDSQEEKEILGKTLKNEKEKLRKKEEVFELISALKELNYDDEISLDIINNLEKTLKTIL